MHSALDKRSLIMLSIAFSILVLVTSFLGWQIERGIEANQVANCEGLRVQMRTLEDSQIRNDAERTPEQRAEFAKLIADLDATGRALCSDLDLESYGIPPQ